MGQDSLESCPIPVPRIAALPFPSTFLLRGCASRLVSCDISLKQLSLGELASAQERWFWPCPFPPHLQMGAGTEQWEKSHPMGYMQRLSLLQGTSCKGKLRGRSLHTSKRNNLSKVMIILKPCRQVTSLQPSLCLQRRWVSPLPGPVSKLASPVEVKLLLPVQLCHRVPTLAGWRRGRCNTHSPWTGSISSWRRGMEKTWKLAPGGFNPV